MSNISLPIYLDYNATTPIHPEVVNVIRPFLDNHFGNPSSFHYFGTVTKTAVEKARKQTADLLGCSANEIVFTSGGTESDNYAIKGYAWANSDKGNHIITSNVEHPAIMKVCGYLENNGFDVSYVPVDKFGMVQPYEVEKVIQDNTILISIMHANNEVGTIQPIREISKIAQTRKIVFHTDAAQSIGKILCKVDELGVDMLTVAGHKLYASKGVGAIYIREGVKLEALLHGASHEQGQRASTENVIGIVGLGKACELIDQAETADQEQLIHLRDLLQTKLENNISDLRLNGHPEQRLPNTLSLSFLGIKANELVLQLKDKVAVSAGAACHGSDVQISHVLEAMDVAEEWAMGTIRFSIGHPTTEEEIEQSADLVTEAVEKLRIRN